MLAAFGVFYAILFRITKNLATLWPLTWAVSSSIGTLQGGFSFGWNDASKYAMLLAIQIAALAWMIWQSQSHSADSLNRLSAARVDQSFAKNSESAT